MKTAYMRGQRGPFAQDLIARREEFKASALRGEREVHGWTGNSGRLPDDFLPQWRTGENPPHRYVVWSYGTPIAWVTHDGTVVHPDARYSPTTSRHQSITRGALR